MRGKQSPVTQSFDVFIVACSPEQAVEQTISCPWFQMSWCSCDVTVMQESDCKIHHHRVDSRLAPNQWEKPLQSNAVSHWLGANLKSALHQSDPSSTWAPGDMMAWYAEMERLSAWLLYCQPVSPFYRHDLTLIPGWINNYIYIYYKV